MSFVTSVGYRHGGALRRELGYPGGGPSVIITDLGVVRPDPDTKEFTLVALHSGVTVDQARDATGWDLEVAHEPVTTDPQSHEELRVLRDMRARTEQARGGQRA